MLFDFSGCYHRLLRVGMCYLVHRMWRTLMVPMNCSIRQLYTSSVICWQNKPLVLACQSATHVSDFYLRPKHNVVQSFLCSSSLSTTASYKLAGFSQHDFCNSSLPSVAPQRVVVKTSQLLSSSCCCNKAKTVDRQNYLNTQQSRHYIPRQLTSPTKTIVDASPLLLRPYLRLIRFDRPIGIVIFYVLFNWPNNTVIMSHDLKPL